MNIVQICLWIIDSGCSKHMTGNRALLTNFMEKFLGTVRFSNNDFAVIAGYGDVVIGSMTIKKFYYVEASNVIISCIKKTQVNLQLHVQHVRTDNGKEFKNKTLDKFFDEVGITQQFSAARTPQQNDVVERRNRTLVEAARTMLTFANLPFVFNLIMVRSLKKTLAKFFVDVGITQQFSAARTTQQNGVVERRNRTLVEAARTMLTFANLPLSLWAEAIATTCFTQNRLIIHKRFDKTPYELMKKRKPNIKFFRVFGCRCYLLNDYEDVGKLKAKGDIGVFVGYSKEFAAFRIYNKRTQPGLSKLNKTGKSSNPSVSQVSETSKKDLEDLFHNFYDEYFDSSKIMKSSAMNVETSNVEIPSHEEEVFHESSESFQEESSSSSLNDDVQQSPEEVILPQTLEDVYFDASTSFHDPSNVYTFYQPYPHEKKWTKDHPLYKIIGDPKSSVRTRGQLANSCLFPCLLSSIEPANVAEALRDADWVSAM
nr:hypothetical protein [Tanacetum cinerariifolium]